MLLLFLNIKFWEILTFVWFKVFLYWVCIFFKKFEKKNSEKVAKFLKNDFLVLSEQSRTKLKDSRKNQNQTITKCFSKFETKPNPTQTRPKPNQTQKNWNSRNFNLNRVIVIKIWIETFYFGKKLYLIK
jgi:hypothetical protein